MDRIIRDGQGLGHDGNSAGNNNGGLEQFPKDWGISGIGELETCLPPKYDEFVRARLSEVSAKAEAIWKNAPLGESAEVKNVRALHHWTVARVTVKEERSVEVAVRPYKNEILPKVTVESPDEVDPYAYDLFADHQDEGEESLEVVGSAQVVSCDHCNKGKVPCDKCHGTGKVSCERCEGEGRLECSECVGGQVRGARGKKNCPRCKGRGDVDCPDCRDGKAKCTSCEGKGASSCPVCKGHSKVIRFIRVKGKRVRSAEVENILSPSLAPMVDMANLAQVSVIFDPHSAISLDDVKYWISDDCDLAEEARISPDLVASIHKCRELVRVEKKRLDNVGQPSVMINLLITDLASNIYLAFTGIEIGLEGADYLRASGLGYPLELRGDAEVSRLDSLSVRLGEDDRPDDDAVFAAVILTKPLQGNDTSFGRFSDDPGDNLAALLSKLPPPVTSTSAGQRMVRNYVRIFVRSWIGVDYSYDGKEYFAFVGKRGIYSQGSSPIVDAATHLVEDARAQLSSEVTNSELIIEDVKRALSNLRLWPDAEALASFLTELPKAKISSGDKFRILDAVNGRFDAMDARRKAFLGILKTPEKDEYDTEEDCQIKREFEKELLLDWILKLDNGRVTRNLVNAVMEQVKSAVAIRNGLIGGGIVVAAILAFVAFVLINAGPESASPAAPEPALVNSPPPAVTVAPVIPPSQPDTDCGNVGVSTPVGVSADRWSLYRCIDESAAEGRWGLCLGRSKYTRTAGRGCPGKEMCCPPE